MSRKDEVTELLGSGLQEGAGRERLLGMVYDELREIAERRMQAERGSHTLQATALVHEAWMRLSADQDMAWENRRHFYGAAAEAMRRVLIDHARRARAQKRGGGDRVITLGADDIAAELDDERALAVCDALEVLAKEDERAAAVARMRFLTGLSAEDTARALGISERTVRREWTYARARLVELLEE